MPTTEVQPTEWATLYTVPKNSNLETFLITRPSVRQPASCASRLLQHRLRHQLYCQALLSFRLCCCHCTKLAIAAAAAATHCCCCCYSCGGCCTVCSSQEETPLTAASARVGAGGCHFNPRTPHLHARLLARSLTHTLSNRMYVCMYMCILNYFCL